MIILTIVKNNCSTQYNIRPSGQKIRCYVKRLLLKYLYVCYRYVISCPKKVAYKTFVKNNSTSQYCIKYYLSVWTFIVKYNIALDHLEKINNNSPDQDTPTIAPLTQPNILSNKHNFILHQTLIYQIQSKVNYLNLNRANLQTANVTCARVFEKQFIHISYSFSEVYNRYQFMCYFNYSSQ